MADDSKLDELLDRWEESLEEGIPELPEVLCADHPELLEPLKQKIAALEQINGQLKTRHLVDPDASEDPLRDADATPTLELSFEQLRFLNQGALGVVYLARERKLNRDVALKFIGHRIAHRQESVNQFLQEAEITSRLDHPGVVPVYGLGKLPNGRMYYAMRYIQGTNLKTAIDEYHGDEPSGSRSARSLAFRKLLTHFVVACKTMAYAHRRGIIHRDMKPEHVMLGRYGETLVVDWGLAIPVGRTEPFKDNHEETLMPQLGSGSGSSTDGAGTLAYMSPEQVAGGISLGPATDIYSLGVILYRLLSGSLPYEAKTNAEMRQLIMNGAASPPSVLKPEVPQSLDAVCMKAFARVPADRYVTALDLATDIERYLADEPVSVLRENRSQKLARWTRRNRIAAQTIVAGLLLVAFAAVASSVALVNSSNAAQEARDQSLATSATFASRMLAQEIEGRWSVLTASAADPKLAEILSTFNQHSKSDDEARLALFDEANTWLQRHRQQFDKSFPSASWMLLDERGVQCARVSIDGKSQFNESFAYRCYFHGGELELPREEAGDAKPLQKPSISPPYRSTTFDVPTVTLSVPVRIDGAVKGVLTMSVTAGDFHALKLSHPESQQAVLVDVRPDSTHQRGVVLHHGGIDVQARKTGDPFIYLEQDLAERWNAEAITATEPPRPFNSEGLFPTVKDQPRQIAVARSPVLVRPESDEYRACGWQVLMLQAAD